jgi:hypothetical protein
LATTVTVIVAVFEPLVGETVSQAALSVIVQDVLEVILNVPVEFASAGTDIDVVDKFRYAAEPAWFIVTVCGLSPLPVTVTGAVREEAEVLPTAVTVIVASFEPLSTDRMSHETSSEILHEVFELIVNVPVDPAVAAIDNVEVDKFRKAEAPA